MWLVVLPEDGFERDDLAFGFSCMKIQPPVGECVESMMIVAGEFNGVGFGVVVNNDDDEDCL